MIDTNSRDELRRQIRDAIKAPIRSKVSTADIQVMGISSTKMSEILFDIDKLIDTALHQQAEAMLAAIDGLEVDIEATTKHIASKGGTENDVLNMEIEADDRHEVLNDCRQAIKEQLNGDVSNG